MNIERKNIDEVNIVLTMQVEKADYQENVEKALKEYRKRANMPGFRPGQVPIALVKKMYGKSAAADELNKVIYDSLQKYIADNKLNVLGEPLPSETEKADIDFDSDKPSTIVFDVALAPEINVDLNGRNSFDYYEIKVDDKMIDATVKQHTGRFGSYVDADETVEDDLLKGEVVELENGKVKEGGIKNEAAILGPKYIKDADQKSLFLGIKKGGVIVFTLKKIMDSDTEMAAFLKIKKEDVANIPADQQFQLTVNEITRYKQAELNQELFDKVFGKDVVKSEDEFKAKIIAGIKENLELEGDFKLLSDIRNYVIGKLADTKFPEAFLKRWVKATRKNEVSDEDLDKNFPAMVDGLKWQLAQNRIAEKHSIKVEEKDILDFAKKAAKAQFAQYGMVNVPEESLDQYAKSMLKEEGAARQIAERVIDEKVLAAVKGAVKLNKKEVSIDEFNEMIKAEQAK